MATRALLLYLGASHGRALSQAANGGDPEKGPPNITVIPQGPVLDDEPTEEPNDIDNEGDDTMASDARLPRKRRFSSATAFTSFSTISSITQVKGPPRWLSKVKEYIFPPKEDLDSFIPNYRYTPIISGVIIPFSILLEIPGLTEHWYIRTENNQTVEYRPNPIILDVGMGFSIACALIANVCLIMRFLEKRVKTMTILCTILLTIHDLINITAVTVFGVAHRFDDGFTYGQPFWMTVCSTIISSITNGTLIWDLYRTPDFNKSGSGLTRKQRSLVIIIMILFCYIAFGALVNSLLQHLTFINGLYFTLVSIETIGFGDIVPKTTSARVFSLIYTIIGILNLGVAIGMCRETVLEAMEVGYRKRVKGVRERRKEGRRRRRVEARWRHGIEWRLREMGVPVWVRDEKAHSRRAGGGGRGAHRPEAPGALQHAAEWIGLYRPEIGHSHLMHGPSGMRLNLQALTHAQLEASALEAGVPLDTLLPEGFVLGHDDATIELPVPHQPAGDGWAQHPLAKQLENAFHPTQARTLTHARIGGMAALMTRFAVAGIHGHAMSPDERARAQRDEDEDQNDSNNGPTDSAEKPAESSHEPQTTESYHRNDLGAMEDLEKKAFYAKLTVAWSLFIIFWFVGSAIFMTTEGWTYGTAMYFCFVAFSTIGYGDYSPQTPAGRSIFVVWAILGVGTMTILVSIVQEAYDSRYKHALHLHGFDKAVKRYRQRVDQARVSAKRTKVARRQERRGAEAEASRARGTSQISLLPVNPILPADSSRRSMVSTIEDDPNQVVVYESHVLAQDTLEALPLQVLSHAKAFQNYVRFSEEGAAVLDDHHSDGGSQHEEMSEISNGLRILLDEIAGAGANISKATKEEILHDTDARHTLFMLSIERALHKMVDAAEDALKAIQERDILTAQLKQLQEATLNTDSKDANAVTSEGAIPPIEESVTKVEGE